MEDLHEQWDGMEDLHEQWNGMEDLHEQWDGMEDLHEQWDGMEVLGLTLDPKLTYRTHILNISVEAHKPLQMIKALTATGWGKQKETLMATHTRAPTAPHVTIQTENTISITSPTQTYNIL